MPPPSRRRLASPTPTSLLALLLPALACTETADGGRASADAGADLGGPGLADNFGVEETEGSSDCEPLDPAVCMLPFPSDRFREVGQDGARVAFGASTLLQTADGLPMDAAHLGGDGFSPATPILFSLLGAHPPYPDGPAHLAESLQATSPTLLVDGQTGELVAHWLELDHLTRASSLPLLVIRPARALEHSRRYLVAVRGLVDERGEPVPASPTFAVLRDGEASRTRGLHARRAHFDAEVFPALERAGAARAELQLAWDFTTASDRTTLELLELRDRFVAALDELGPEYVIREVEADPDPAIAWLLKGVAQVPSVLLPPDEDGIRLLRRDANGRPEVAGVEEVEFDLQLPHAAYEAPAAVLQYGHGLLGRRSESHKGWLRELAQRKGFVVVAIDMQGMNEDDGFAWLGVLANAPARFPDLADKVVQGLLNHLALVRMAAGRFAADADPRFNPEGRRLVDPARLYYYGISQGGTLGNMLMTLHTEVRRGVLGVPGCAYAFLLQRSAGFATFAGALRGMFPEPWGLPAILAVIQHGFDRIEPLNVLRHLGGDKRVLLQVAKEDAAVPNDVSFLLARTYGVPLLTPGVRPIWGLAEEPAPYAGSVLAEYDFGVPDNPDPVAPPPAETDTHEDLRRLGQAQDQLWHFLETGEAASFCSGPCDPD